MKQAYIETYGCQMNFSDSEIVKSILTDEGFEITENMPAADLILLNTCSIRDNAEQRVIKRLQELKFLKQKNSNLIIGLIGCMAERLKEQILEQEKYIDLIVGPDGYRSLPQLIQNVDSGQKAINVILSADETYADINPVRTGDNGVTAFISIMRGCENFCAYCVVPYTRGKERSRDIGTIVKEAETLFEKGYREVTLLGQNVNSYHSAYEDYEVEFPALLEAVAQVNPLLRVRFATSHPKDFSDDLISVISEYDNICKAIHLPMQSGSSSVLKRMKRGYSFDWYYDRVKAIQEKMPNCALSTDIIAGFCDETENEHLATIEAMKQIKFDAAFMFKYSERPNTFAAKNLKDNVSESDKSRRLTEIINLQQEHSLLRNNEMIGKRTQILIEGISKRSENQVFGRNTQNKVVIVDRNGFKPGDYVDVEIISASAATLIGKVI